MKLDRVELFPLCYPFVGTWKFLDGLPGHTVVLVKVTADDGTVRLGPEHAGSPLELRDAGDGPGGAAEVLRAGRRGARSAGSGGLPAGPGPGPGSGVLDRHAAGSRRAWTWPCTIWRAN